LTIIAKDKNNEIFDIDSIFKEGAKIELRLSANLGNESGEWVKKWSLKEEGEWKEDGNNTFILHVNSDYKIITSTKKVEFI